MALLHGERGSTMGGDDDAKTFTANFEHQLWQPPNRCWKEAHEILGSSKDPHKFFKDQAGPPPSKSKASQMMWARQKDMILKQVSQAQAQVLLHMNKKHNDTFFMAPGVTTEMIMSTVFGYAYHINTVLVKAECPSNYTKDLRAITAKDCKSQPESPKMECNFEVTELLGIGFYITREECHEYTPPPSKGDNNPDKSAADPTDPHSQEDEGGSYV